MTEITVDISEETYLKLTKQALKNGLNPEEELKRILIQGIHNPTNEEMNKKDFLQRVKNFSQKLGPQRTDSTQIIRDLREFK